MFERRAVLAGIAGLPFVAAPPAALAVVSGIRLADPFTTYHQRILALHAAIEADPGEDEADRLMDRWSAIDREALAGAPTTLAGVVGALQMARREFHQFHIEAHEDVEGGIDRGDRLILHLLDSAVGVLRQAAAGGVS